MPQVTTDLETQSSVESTTSSGAKVKDGFLMEGVYDPENYELIEEHELVTPPDIPLRDVAVDRDIILDDLKRTSTASIAWDSDVRTAVLQGTRAGIGTSPSQQLFNILRSAFEDEGLQSDTAEMREFRDELGINHDYQAPGRMEFATDESWTDIQTDNPYLQTLQAFTKAAATQALTIVKQLKGITDAQIEDLGLETSINYYYIPKGPASVKTLDMRGMHEDWGVLQLGAADQPAVVIKTAD